MPHYPISNLDSLSSATFIIPIISGVGDFSIPISLRESIFQTFIVAQAVESFSNFGTSYYITSNASYYINHNNLFRENILATFCSQNKLTEFKSKIKNALNQTPNEIQVYFNKYEDEVQKLDKTYSGNLTVTLFGYTRRNPHIRSYCD